MRASDQDGAVSRDDPMTDGRLTRAALVEKVAQAAELTKQHAEIIVDAVFGGIVETLHREKVELRGFGSFRLRRREQHRRRNPRTGDPVEVPPKRVACFTPGKELKALINRDPDESILPASSRVVRVDRYGGLER